MIKQVLESARISIFCAYVSFVLGLFDLLFLKYFWKQNPSVQVKEKLLLSVIAMGGDVCSFGSLISSFVLLCQQFT